MSGISYLLNSSPEIWWRVFSRLDKYPDLAESLGYTALNTSIVACKLFSQLPQMIGRTASLFMSSLGLLSLKNYYWKLISKNCRDLYWAVRASDYLGIFLTMIKTVVKAVDALLCCGCFAASLSTLLGFPVATALLYSFMRPVGLGSLLCGIAFEFSDYYLNGKVIQEMMTVKSHEIFRQFQHIFANQNLTECRLGLRLIRQVDAETIAATEEKMQATRKDISDDLVDTLRKAVLSYREFSKANLGLTAFGYFCVGVGRVFPDTLLQSSLQWFTGMLYTGKLAIEKYKIEERCEIIYNM